MSWATITCSTLTFSMALKLITTLTVVILASFAYKVWDKTKVPDSFTKDDAWKVKTIEFACRICQKLKDFIKYLDGDIYKLRTFCSFVFNSLHYGVWPFSSFYQPMNESFITTEHTEIAGVPVIIYKNVYIRKQMNKAVFIYFHGGGWEWLGADDPGPTLRSLAKELGVLTVSVDYRLAPQHPYPSSLDDCLRVTETILRRPRYFNIDESKVMVGGDNAGGNLAAAVALKLGKRLRLQVLIYPILQAVDFHTQSYKDNYGKLKYINQPEQIARSVAIYGNLSLACMSQLLENRRIASIAEDKTQKNYLKTDNLLIRYTFTPNTEVGCTKSEDLSRNVKIRVTDPLFMPLMASSLDSVTDAYIVTAHHDVLRDDGLMYAARLSNSSGVSVKLKHYARGFHNFFHFSEGPLKLDVAHQALYDLIYFIKLNVIQQL